VLNLLTGLLVLGSSLAFYAIISGGGVALQVSYCVPILCVVLRGRHHLPPRPHFDLGRWGYAVNITGLLWSIIVILFYIFPQYVPVVGAIAVSGDSSVLKRTIDGNCSANNGSS
jgi:choline transport protein